MMKKPESAFILFVLLFTPLFCFSQQELKYDSLLNDSFFSKTIYRYPWWIFEDDIGGISSIFEKPDLTKEENKKKIVTSVCTVTYKYPDLSSSYQQFSIYTTASLINDTLVLKIMLSSPPHYEIYLARIYNGKISSHFEEAPSEAPEPDIHENDSTRLHPFSSEQITLNKLKYKKGDLLQAAFCLSFRSDDPNSGNNNSYTTQYKGWVKCLVD